MGLPAFFMKTDMEKTTPASGKNRRSFRSNKTRLKRLLREMLASGVALELCPQSSCPPAYRRIIE
jgi:hypothetical protein